MTKALSSSEQYSTKVVGTSFCQENLIRVCGPKKKESVELEVPAELILENDNQADVNAVAVMVNDLKVGYLPKREAMIHRIFIHGSDYIKDRLICIGKISGGWDNGYGNCGHYGVTVELPYKAGPESSCIRSSGQWCQKTQAFCAPIISTQSFQGRLEQAVKAPGSLWLDPA